MACVNLKFVVFGNAAPKREKPPFFAVKCKAGFQTVFVANALQHKGGLIVKQTPGDHIIVQAILLSCSQIDPVSFGLHL